MKTHYSVAVAPGSIRSLTFVILAVALAVGAWLRFANLAARDLSADEGASWAAAMAPSVGQVLQRHSQLNPATIGLDDAALHEWMRQFGDGLGAMRALSASAGTIAILFVFAVTRELLQLDSARAFDSDTQAAGAAESTSAKLISSEYNLIAAGAALVFAVNLVTVKYSREARMYPLLLLATLVQFTCFARASRRGGLANYVGVAIFTAAALALHPCAVFAFAAEGLWILYVLCRARFKFGAIASRRGLGLVAAMVAGVAMLAPAAPRAISAGTNAASHGVFSWISRPAWWELFALFNKATGSFAFPLMVALAIWGAVSAWSRARAGVGFILLWMWAPPIIVMILSYLLRPAFVERYLLSSFVPFFILVAIGIWELPRLSHFERWSRRCGTSAPPGQGPNRPMSAQAAKVRAAALVALVLLALGHVRAYDHKPHGAQWGEAAAVAAAALEPGDQLVVAPGYAANAVRYYLRNGPNAGAPQPVGDRDSAATVAIIADQGVAPPTAARLRHAYPHPLAHLRGLVVRHR